MHEGSRPGQLGTVLRVQLGGNEGVSWGEFHLVPRVPLQVVRVIDRVWFLVIGSLRLTSKRKQVNKTESEQAPHETEFENQGLKGF